MFWWLMRLGSVAMAFRSGSHVEYWYLQHCKLLILYIFRNKDIRVLVEQLDRTRRVDTLVNNVNRRHWCWGRRVLCKPTGLEDTRRERKLFRQSSCPVLSGTSVVESKIGTAKGESSQGTEQCSPLMTSRLVENHLQSGLARYPLAKQSKLLCQISH